MASFGLQTIMCLNSEPPLPDVLYFECALQPMGPVNTVNTFSVFTSCAILGNVGDKVPVTKYVC